MSNRRSMFTVTLLLVAGCDRGAADATPSRVHDATVLAVDQIRSIEADALVVDADAQLRSGDVVVSEGGTGVLRRVEAVAVAERGGARRVVTSPAHLGDVVEDGEFHMALALYDGEELPQRRAMSGPTLEGATWSIGDTKITADAGLDIRVKEGSFYFDPNLFLDFTVKDHYFQQFAIGAYGDLGAALELEIKSEAKNKVSHKVWKIATTPSFKFVGSIGPVPVVVTTKLELNLGASFTGKGAMSATQRVGIDGWVDLGATYDGQWSILGDHDFSLLQAAPIVSATGEAVGKVYLEGKLSFSFYDVVGPTFALQPYGEVAVQSGSPLSWRTSAGVAGKLGGEVKVTDIYKIGVEATLFDWKQPLAAGKLGASVCQAQAGAAPWLGTQKCNRAAALGSFGALESCIKGGGGKACLTAVDRYPSTLCGPSSGGGYTCKLDEVFACICNGGGQACLGDAKALCKL